MNRKITIVLAAILVGAAWVTLGPSPAKGGPVELTYSNFFPPTHIQSKLAEAWCKEVERRTNGAVKISYYPGQTLTKAKQTYDAVVSGMADIGFSILQYTRGRFPLMDVINLPLGYPSGQVATAIINEVVDKFHPKELSDTQVMYLHSHGPGFIHTKGKAIHSMEDLKGLKIRSHGPTAEMLKALGGTPVAFPMPELYQSLQKGVVNGGIYPMEANKGWRLAEVTDYAAACYSIAYGLGFFVVMNKEKWNSLSPEIQKTIQQINREWILKHGEAWDSSDMEGIRYFLAMGNTIIGIGPKESRRWKEAVQPVLDMYIKETSSKGLPGKEVLQYVQGRLEEARKGTFKSPYMR